MLQTQHGVTQCWAEEQSQRRVWINTYPSILQTLSLTCLFFYCLLLHCLGLYASKTAWGHTMLGLRTKLKKSLNKPIPIYPSNFDFDLSVFLLSFVALPLAMCFKHSMGSHNVGPRNRAQEESELTHTNLSFKLWLWLFFFLLSFVALPRALCFKHSMGSHNVGPRNRVKVWRVLINTYQSILQTLTLTCLFFFVLCGIASGSVLQTQHGVTQCWAEEKTQRRVLIKTYPSILQTFTCLFFATKDNFFCFFIVFCGIASRSVLQTQHGVTQCWAEEESQRRVWINTYQSVLQTLTLTCLFFIVFCGIASGSVL